jgi:LysM repeat protein
MAAIEIWEDLTEAEIRGQHLRLVTTTPAMRQFRTGTAVAQRRATRARMVRRRRRSLAVVALVALAWTLLVPGHAFGGTTSGVPYSMEGTIGLTSGTIYVVQAGDTLASIAQQINPVTPKQALAALVHELKSTVVITGEHIVIP